MPLNDKEHLSIIEKNRYDDEVRVVPTKTFRVDWDVALVKFFRKLFNLS
jgi:hypothetical protein